jgi:hypothetical protein
MSEKKPEKVPNAVYEAELRRRLVASQAGDFNQTEIGRNDIAQPELNLGQGTRRRGWLPAGLRR